MFSDHILMYTTEQLVLVLTACMCKIRHACCLAELHMCRLYLHNCDTSPVTPDVLMSVMHNGTGKNHFAGVTCIPALHTHPALAACCYKGPVLLLPLLCMHCCSLTPSHAVTAYHKPAAACPRLLLAMWLWGSTGHTANRIKRNEFCMISRCSFAVTCTLSTVLLGVIMSCWS